MLISLEVKGFPEADTLVSANYDPKQIAVWGEDTGIGRRIAADHAFSSTPGHAPTSDSLAGVRN